MPRSSVHGGDGLQTEALPSSFNFVNFQVLFYGKMVGEKPRLMDNAIHRQFIQLNCTRVGGAWAAEDCWGVSK